MKHCMWAGGGGVVLGFILIVVMFLTNPPLSVAGFVVIFVSMCFLACVNHRITNTVRMMLLTATTYENQVYKDRVPPVRWIVDEWRLVTTTVTSGGRHGPRTSQSSQTFFDLHVEVGQAVQPQMVVHQHVYGAPVPYGAPPAGYGPPGAYGQPPVGQYGAPPTGYMPPQAGYPPAGYPPQQWSPNNVPPPSQPYYGQPPPQQWAPQPAAPAYSSEGSVDGAVSYNNDTTSSKLLSSSDQSDA